MDFLGIGGGEILLIIVIALILWGPGRIVEIARTLGKIVNNFKNISSDLATQVTQELDQQKMSGTPESTEVPKLSKDSLKAPGAETTK